MSVNVVVNEQLKFAFEMLSDRQGSTCGIKRNQRCQMLAILDLVLLSLIPLR